MPQVGRELRKLEKQIAPLLPCGIPAVDPDPRSTRIPPPPPAAVRVLRARSQALLLQLQLALFRSHTQLASKAGSARDADCILAALRTLHLALSTSVALAAAPPPAACTRTHGTSARVGGAYSSGQGGEARDELGGGAGAELAGEIGFLPCWLGARPQLELGATGGGGPGAFAAEGGASLQPAINPQRVASSLLVRRANRDPTDLAGSEACSTGMIRTCTTRDPMGCRC